MNLVSVLRSASIRFPEAALPASKHFPDDVSYYDPAEVADQTSWEWENYWYLTESKKNFLDDEVDLAWKEHDTAVDETAFDEYNQYIDTILSTIRSSWSEWLVESAGLENDDCLANEQRKQARAQRRRDTKRRKERRKRLVDAVNRPKWYKPGDTPWRAYGISVKSNVRTEREDYTWEYVKRGRQRYMMRRWAIKAAAHDLFDYTEAS